MTDLELVEAAVAGRDDRLALHYLAQVLATSPNDEKGLALLAGISTRLDVLKFVPGKSFVGNTVLRAWALERLGSPEAIRLLARAATSHPDRGYDVVLASWLVARQAAGQSLPEPERHACYRFLASVLDATVGLHRLWPGEQALLEGAIACAGALAAFKDDAGVLLTSAALRRSGRPSEALELTHGGAGRDDVLMLRAHGLSLRTAGQGAEAARVFERVESFEPEPSEILEQARSWYVAGAPYRALEVLRRIPRPWNDEVRALERLCLDPAPADPIAALDRQLRRLKGHGLLVARGDATASALRQRAADGVMGPALRVSRWESPSNRLALAMASGKGTDVGAAEYVADFGEVSFDPLAAEGSLALWGLDRGCVRQAVAAPALEVREAVRKVAAAGDDGLLLLEAAEVEARRFSADQALFFAHAMVHPLEGVPGPDALYRWQCAAAALIAHLPGPIDGPRGQTLRALALGQIDWTGSAAVFALAHLARHDADAARFARQALIDAVSKLVPHAGEPRAEQLRVALSTIPTVPPSAVSALDARARALAGR